MDVVKIIRESASAPVKLISGRGPVVFVQGGIPDVLTTVATASFSSGRLVAYVGGQLVYYDAANVSHLFALVGMSLNAANPGEVLQIKTQGEVTIPGWGLTPDAIYFAGTLGQVALQTPASAGFSQVIGRAKSVNSFMLSPQIIYKNG